MTNQVEAPGVEKYMMTLEDQAPPMIDIDGVEYALASPDDYGMAELRAIQTMWTKVVTWEQADKLTVKESEEYDKCLDALCKYACPSLPQEIVHHRNFRRSNKSAIVLAFFLEAGKRHPLLKKTLLESLQDSNDSTEAL